MKFHYALQRALDEAVFRERRCATALVAIRGAVRHELGLLESLAADEQRVRARPDGDRAALSQALLAAAGLERERCFQAFAVRRAQRHASLRLANARLARAEEGYRATAVRRRALERLRDRRYLRHLEREERRDADELDESNTLHDEARSAAARKGAS